jgi:acyl carrier protein
MSIKEQVMSILKEIKPTKDLSEVTDIIDGAYLDSFELMSLIANLGDTFGIEIDVDEIMPENFNSVDAITAMVERLKG